MTTISKNNRSGFGSAFEAIGATDATGCGASRIRFKPNAWQGYGC
jgi:hypothetical protein